MILLWQRIRNSYHLPYYDFLKEKQKEKERKKREWHKDFSSRLIRNGWIVFIIVVCVLIINWILN